MRYWCNGQHICLPNRRCRFDSGIPHQNILMKDIYHMQIAMLAHYNLHNKQIQLVMLTSYCFLYLNMRHDFVSETRAASQIYFNVLAAGDGGSIPLTIAVMMV